MARTGVLWEGPATDSWVATGKENKGLTVATTSPGVAVVVVAEVVNVKVSVIQTKDCDPATDESSMLSSSASSSLKIRKCLSYKFVMTIEQ